MSSTDPAPDSDSAAPVAVVAIDGPSGAGKSTVARRLAARLGWAYLDTGAMYRAVTWFLLGRGWTGSADQRLFDWLTELELEVGNDARIRVGGVDVTDELRSRPVEAAVSEVSSLPAVRARMTELQRAIGRRQPLVAEGRDMATVVFPQARHKFFVDAALEERARRRFADFSAAGREVSMEVVRDELAARDRYDSSREAAPLRCDEGAEVVDTTSLSIEQVVELLASRVRADLCETEGA